MPKLTDKVASNVLNRASTFAIRKSVDEIISTNNLKKNYVESKFKKVSRASPNNLRTIISANDRRTLLARYPHSKTSDGVSVSVKRGVSRVIRRGFIVTNLKGSSATGVAIPNEDFVSYLQTSNTRSKLRSAKLSRARTKLKDKPKGWTVLHGASINQMFTNVRQDIKRPLATFMIKEFFKEFKSKV